VGRRRAARPRDRGGGSIPPLRASRIRLAVLGVALLLGGALVAFPLVGADEAAPALWPLATISFGLLVASVRWPSLLAPLLLALAAELVTAALHASLDPAVLVSAATALLLLCELLAWAATLRSDALVDRAALGRRAVHLVAAVLVGATASALTVAGHGISAPNAFVAGVAGAAAVAALLALVWALGRESV
jgi:hypothetical protein